jgi:hypothetical protein
LVSLKQVTADLAPDLRFLLAVVVVEIVVRSIADRTNNQFRDCVRFGPAADRAKLLPMKSLVLS